MVHCAGTWAGRALCAHRRLSSLVPMLTCRFIANLRNASLQESTTIGEHDPASTLRFNPTSARVLDSVAGPSSMAEDESIDDADDGVRAVLSELQSGC